MLAGVQAHAEVWVGHVSCVGVYVESVNRAPLHANRLEGGRAPQDLQGRRCAASVVKVLHQHFGHGFACMARHRASATMISHEAVKLAIYNSRFIAEQVP